MRTRPGDLPASRTGLPSTVILSTGPARSPSLATEPLTLMRPASIQDSISRREPRPAAARTFWSRSAFCTCPLAFSACGLLRFRVGWAGARFGGGDGLKLQRLRDFLEGRQLFQRAQPEVIEEFPGGRVERRPTRRLAVADDVDPAAGFQ